MTGFNIDQRFVPYVSFEHNLEEQAVRLNRWLKKSQSARSCVHGSLPSGMGSTTVSTESKPSTDIPQTESKWRRAVRRWRGKIAG